MDSKIDCSPKILISLTVENGQKGGEETIEFVQNSFKDSSQNQIQLEKPLTLTVSKNPVKVLYRLLYKQHFSDQVQEKVITQSLFTCSEGTFQNNILIKDSSCGFARNADGSVINYSGGFCCSCSLYTILTGNQTGVNRGECGMFQANQSAHCLLFSDQLYAAFEVKELSYIYDIDLNLTYTKSTGEKVQTTE